MIQVVVFEDAHWRDLRPLTDLVPTPALAFGGSSLAERLAAAAGAPLAGLVARPGAVAACATLPAVNADALPGDGAVLVLNASACPGDWLSQLATESGGALASCHGRIAGARLTAAQLAAARTSHGGFEEALGALRLADRSPEVRFLEWPWDLVAGNSAAIAGDLAGLAPTRDGDIHPSVAVLGEAPIAIARGARVDPHVVLDAREGPIRIDAGASIQAHTLVVGPCVVGAGTQLLGGVVGRSSFGRQCRVAGEVDETIWQGFANKRHHGFVGHSLIGEWVNLGALTTTSDLKNNYGAVRVWVDGREVDSRSSKVGSFLGAHVKTGIGTLLPTGASIGTGSNLFGGGAFAPKHVPAFSWWDGRRYDVHRLDAFLATARIAMGRRDAVLTDEAAAALSKCFEATRPERLRV